MRGTIEGADCENCPFANKEGKPDKPVVAEGPKSPLFIICGEGPGRNEVKAGRPFVGASGSEIDKTLKACGVKREEVWITNAALCIKPNASQGARKRAAEACKGRLSRELKQFPEKPIISVGGISTEILTEQNEVKITQVAGTYEDTDFGGKHKVVSCIHPARMLHGKGTFDNDLLYLRYDFGKVAALARGQMQPFSYDIEYELADPRKALDLVGKVYTDAFEKGWFALDTETSGRTRNVFNHLTGETVEHKHSALEGYYADLVAIGIATDSIGISIPWVLAGEGVKELIGKLLSNPRITMVNHNKSYDIPVLLANGFVINGPTEDTLLKHHNLFPGLIHNLQRVGSQFYLLKPWKSEFRDADSRGYDSEEGLIYNASDTLVTARLRKPLGILLNRDKPKTYLLDERMAEITIKMHRDGVPYSRSFNSQLANYFKPQIDGISNKFRKIVDDPESREAFFERIAMEQGRTKRKADSADYYTRVLDRKEELEKKFAKGKFDFNLNATVQCAAYLGYHGVPLTKRTEKSKKLSTSGDILMQLAHYEQVGELIRYRSAQKMYSTFILPIPFQMDENDRVHPMWKVHLKTGRTSSSPNQQNLTEGDGRLINGVLVDSQGNEVVARSATDGLVPNLREQIQAPKGRVIVGFDYEQLQAREIAMMSGDPVLLDVFRTGRDIHSEIAAEIFPKFNELDKKSQKRKKCRNVAKASEYGWFFKGSDPTIHKQLIQRGFTDIRLQQVSQMTSIISKKFSGVAQWHQDVLREAHKNKCVSEILLGRKILFPRGNVDPNEAVAFKAQALESAIVNSRFLLLYDALPAGCFPIIHIHDGIYFECDEDQGEYVKELCEKYMPYEMTYNGVTMNYPIVAKVGRHMAEL